jgi:AraC-like DNA-binding protein
MDTLSRLLENVHLYDSHSYRLQACGQWAYTLTKQDVILFYLVESGTLTIEIDGLSRQLYSGDMIMLPDSYHHVCYNTASKKATPLELTRQLEGDPALVINPGHPETAVVILIECQYDKDITRSLLSALPTILPDDKSTAPSPITAIDYSCQILRVEEDRLGKTAMINHLASILMIECLRTYIEQLPEAAETWLTAIKDPYLAKALAVMHDAPNENWTIHKLAEVAGMSRSSFAERFKQVVGVPPLTYLIDYRLRLAARYLRLQQNSISRISELVGYASDSTFSQAFKRVYGLSPRAYRQNYQQRQAIENDQEPIDSLD